MFQQALKIKIKGDDANQMDSVFSIYNNEHALDEFLRVYVVFQFEIIKECG